MALTRALFFIVQGILGFAAVSTTAHEPHVDHRFCDVRMCAIGGDMALPTSSLSPDAILLPATPFKRNAVTSSVDEDIKEAPQKFAFCGHGGPGTAMALTRALFFIVQGILGFAAVSTTAHEPHVDHRFCDVRMCAIGGDMALPTSSLSPDAILLPATPFKRNAVTSSVDEDIKEAPQKFAFCGHGGPGTAMALTRALFFIVQWTAACSILRVDNGALAANYGAEKEIDTIKGDADTQARTNADDEIDLGAACMAEKKARKRVPYTGNAIIDIAKDFRVGLETAREAIHLTLQVLWDDLTPQYMKWLFPDAQLFNFFMQLPSLLWPVPVKPPNEHMWRNIADGFWKRWQFPNCLGSVDGKHVQIVAPANSGSLYYNYKGTFSIVLMAVADSGYLFRLIDVGAPGRISDGGVFKRSPIGRRLDAGQLQVP
ncbi:hypothetical protein MTO96_048737 [Rhipicephalus appendiculatus]